MIDDISVPFVNKIDTEEIKDFANRFITDKLGKGSVKDIRITQYPNEYAINIVLHKKHEKSTKLAFELQGILVKNNVSAMVFID